MSPELETTRAWEKANNACGAIAEAVHALRGTPDATARGNALVLLEEARKGLNAAASLVEFQTAGLARSLRTPAPLHSDAPAEWHDPEI